LLRSEEPPPPPPPAHTWGTVGRAVSAWRADRGDSQVIDAGRHRDDMSSGVGMNTPGPGPQRRD